MSLLFQGFVQFFVQIFLRYFDVLINICEVSDLFHIVFEITPRISPNQISPDQISPAKLAQTQISLNPNQPFPHISPNPNQPKTQISLGPKLAQNPNQPKTQISPGHILVQDPNQLQNPTPSCDLENICLVPTQQVLRRIQQSLAYIGATILNQVKFRLG